MTRDLNCPTGQQAYRVKADAERANPGAALHRCHRCRFWHVSKKRKKARGR